MLKNQWLPWLPNDVITKCKKKGRNHFFYFDILVANRIENEINPGFYIKMKSRGAITRQVDKISIKEFFAPLWKYDVIIIIFTLSMILIML